MISAYLVTCHKADKVFLSILHVSLLPASQRTAKRTFALRRVRCTKRIENLKIEIDDNKLLVIIGLDHDDDDDGYGNDDDDGEWLKRMNIS